MVPFVFWFTKTLTLTIFTQNRWGVWLNFLYRFKGYYNVFCGTENIFCDITYFPQKCATFVVPFVFWFTKMLTLTIFTQNRWGVWLKISYRFKGYYNVLWGTENIFCDITYFPHICATFVVLLVFWFTKMLTLTIFTHNRWGVWPNLLYRFKGYYNVFCGTENIFCDITYFPHKCAAFVVPFVFWFTKMLTLTIFTQNRGGVWLMFLYRFKVFYNVFCGTENIFCDITYFPHKCATFVVLFVFWFTKMLTLTIFTQNRWGVWLKFLCRFKGYYNVLCGTENIFCDITYFPHKCATFVVLFVFWFTKMLTLTIFKRNRWGLWLNFYTDLKGTIMCFVEQKTFSVILRIFLTNEPPLWFPLYFGLQKCWRWQFLHTIVEEYGQFFYADLKFIIMCFVEEKIFSVILRIFLTNAPSLWFPSYLGLHQCWHWQFLVKIVDEYGYNVSADLKVVIICIVEQKTFSVILRIFLTNAPPLWFPLYFGLQKCWRWQFLLKIVEVYG